MARALPPIEPDLHGFAKILAKVFFTILFLEFLLNCFQNVFRIISRTFWKFCKPKVVLKSTPVTNFSFFPIIFVSSFHMVVLKFSKISKQKLCYRYKFSKLLISLIDLPLFNQFCYFSRKKSINQLRPLEFLTENRVKVKVVNTL